MNCQKRFFSSIFLCTFFCAFITVTLASCNKDDAKKKRNYFRGRINGVQIRPGGGFNCTSVSGTYYPEGYLELQEGFFNYHVENCNTGKALIFGKGADLSVGTFTSANLDDLSALSCSFIDFESSFAWPNGQMHSLNANHVEEIRLEIVTLEFLNEHNLVYIEGFLDAVVSDTMLDTTIIVSDIKFGHNFQIP